MGERHVSENCPPTRTTARGRTAYFAKRARAIFSARVFKECHMVFTGEPRELFPLHENV
jgi:hypothetical protein